MMMKLIYVNFLQSHVKMGKFLLFSFQKMKNFYLDDKQQERLFFNSKMVRSVEMSKNKISPKYNLKYTKLTKTYVKFVKKVKARKIITNEISYTF